MKRLEVDLRAAGLSRNPSPLICQSFYQSLHINHRSSPAGADAASWEAFLARQLCTCMEQLQRRELLMRHCSAETRLALAACDWAAEKSQVSATAQQMSGLLPRCTAPLCQKAPDNLSYCVCTMCTGSVLGFPP